MGCLAALVGFACLVAVPRRVLAANDQVVVLVASGRHFSGSIDARSDSSRLWIRVSDKSILLLRPIDWDRVVSARIGDRQFSAEELRAAVGKLASARVEPESHGENSERHPASDSRTPSEHTVGDREASARSPKRDDETGPVTTIQIEAAVCHFGPSVESTGIAVTLRPLDGDGNLVPVDGTLTVDLVGQRFTVVTEGNGFPPLGRWTVAVRASDFGPSGVVYRLPFQAVHPDFTHDLLPHGLVHAQLAVPGEGVFEASRAMVRIRAFSSVRDHAWQTTGNRFLPIEQTDW